MTTPHAQGIWFLEYSPNNGDYDNVQHEYIKIISVL